MCRDTRLVTLCRHQTTPTVPRAPVTPRGSLTQWPLGDPGPDPKPCEPAQVPPPPRPQGGHFSASHTRWFLRWSSFRFFDILKPGRPYLSSWESLSQHNFLQSPPSRPEIFKLRQPGFAGLVPLSQGPEFVGLQQSSIVIFIMSISPCSFK